MDKIKIVAARHFLFEVEPVVSFAGKLAAELSFDDFQKALRKLEVREPLITCSVTLEEDGEAYLLPGTAKSEPQKANVQIYELIDERRKCGFDLSKRLFDFYLIGNETVAIFAHAIVADCKALAYLAGEIAGYAYNSLVSVLPSQITGINSVDDIPSNSVTPLTFNLPNSLNDKWRRKFQKYSLSDLEGLKKAYESFRGEEGRLVFEIDEKASLNLKNICKERKIDLLSLMTYAFWSSLKAEKPSSSLKKICIYFDTRKRLVQAKESCGGNYYTRLLLPVSKKMKGGFLNQVCVFHKNLYNKYINNYHFFNFITFFMGLDPFLSDSQYFSSFCTLKSKPSYKIAKIHGVKSPGTLCIRQYNLEQKSKEALLRFSDIIMLRPFSFGEPMAVTWILFNGRIKVILQYKKSFCDDETAKKIADRAVLSINNL